MANIAIQDGASVGDHLSVSTALRLAWLTWVAFLVLPFFLFLCVVWNLMGRESATVPVERPDWFLAACGYLLLVVPAALFWRGRLFKTYWTGNPIPPGKYLYGMLTIWAALEFGGIIALLGCFVDHALLPNLLPALIAFMFFVTLWPSGKAMVRSVGHLEDASLYEAPR